MNHSFPSADATWWRRDAQFLWYVGTISKPHHYRNKTVFLLLITNMCIMSCRYFLNVVSHTVWQGAELLVSGGSASVGKDVLCLMSRLWTCASHSSAAYVLCWDFMFLWLRVILHCLLLDCCMVTFPTDVTQIQDILGFSSESKSTFLCFPSEELCS